MKPWISKEVVLGAIVCFAGHAAGAVKSIAHRGHSLVAPENTCAAFLASSNVADFVEFDIRATQDGKLVIIHDETVDRTTDGTGLVRELTLAQLKALDAGSWFSSSFSEEPVPSLTEALQCILPFATPLIEQKTGTPQAFVDLLQAMDITSDVVLQSFDWTFLAEVNHLDPDIPLWFLGDGVIFPLTEWPRSSQQEENASHGGNKTLQLGRLISCIAWV